MSKKTVAWLILIGSLMGGAGGVLYTWDGQNWRLLLAGMLMSVGGVLVASFSKGVNQLTNGNGDSLSLPTPVDPPENRPVVRR